MAELILHWINSLKLSKKVGCIEKDFSNGYLFGEILVKLKQLESTSDFICANTPAAHTHNFALLEPVLRRLDIRLDTNKMQLIVEEQDGAALQLLYQIKVAISKLSRNCGRTLSDISRVMGTEKPSYEAVQKRFVDERLRKLLWSAKNESAKTRPTSSRGRDRPLGNRDNGAPATRQHRASTRSPQPPKRRVSREQLQTKRREGASEPDGGYPPGRDTLYETSRSSPSAGVPAALTRKAKSTLLTKSEKEARLSEEEVRRDIAHFEVNLQRLGLDAASSTVAALSVNNGALCGEKQQDLEIELSRRLPSPSACHRENAKMMERLHEARTAQELARKEREKRRQKLLMEQNQARAASAASAIEEALIQKAQRRSKRATAIQYDLWKIKQYQTVIEANRDLRETQYAQKRHQHEVTTARRISYAETVARDSLLREVRHEAAQCRALKKQLHAAKRARLIEESLDIVDLILNMVAAVSFHNQKHDTAVVDSRTWREWLIAFVEEKSALVTHDGDGAAMGRRVVGDCPESFLQLSGPPTADSVPLLHSTPVPGRSSPASVETGSSGIEDCLCEDDFFLYLNGEGQWHVQRNAEEVAGGENLERDLLKGVNASELFTEMLKVNEPSYSGATERLKTEVITNPNGEPTLHQLGSLVSSLLELCYSESPVQRHTDVPACPLRIVITGKPFAGKRTLAKKLGEKFKLHVINFSDLLKEILALQPNPVAYSADNVESFAAEPALASLPPVTPDNQPPGALMLKLATEAQSVLKDGKKLSSQLCVDLCVAKIQELFVPGTMDNVKELLNHVPVKEQPEPPAPHKNDKSGATTARKGQKASANVKDKNQASKETPEESAPQKLGWILVDFPQTYEQCVILEEGLSGYVTPDRLPASELSKKKVKASFVIPLPVQPQSPKSLVEGGVDVHFVLDISTEDVLTRARSTSLSEKSRGSLTVDTKAPDRTVHCAVPVECLRPHSTVSVADECCYIEEEQKVAHLFLSLFGVQGEPRLRILSVKSDAEVLAAACEIIEKVVNRKRQELTSEIVAESHKDASVAAVSIPEPAANACVELPANNRSNSIVGEAEARSSTPEAELLQSGTGEAPFSCLSLASLEPAMKKYLIAKWEALEEEYVATMMKTFAWVRQTRREFTRGIVDIQIHFTELLQRPDSKQEIVETFIVEYNAFLESIPQSFHLESIKEEMHLQVDELAESLWQQIDTRRTEAITEHKRLAEAGWLEAVCLVLAAQLETLVEAELKRYLALEEFATDVYYNILNACIPERKRPSLNRSALKEAAQGAVKQAFTWFCRQKSSGHDSAGHKPWQNHIFEQLEAKAKEHLVPLTEFEDYAPNTVEVDKKKASKSKVTLKEETKPRVEPPLHVELQQTRLDLQVQLLCRLRRLCLWGAARVHVVTKVGNDIFGRMDDWIVARSLAEHAAVRELTTRIKYCIENERQIPHAMRLTGTQLILDPNALLGELEDAEASQCVLPPPPTSAFTIAMLRSLMSDIKMVATGGLITVEALREIILRRVTHSKCFRTPALPQTWLDTPASKLAHIPNYFEISDGSVDVIEFLLSLAFGVTGWPSDRQLHQISCAVRAVSSDAAVAKLCPRSGAAPLEFFISREEFAQIDFGDWLVACSRGDQKFNSFGEDGTNSDFTANEGTSRELQIQGTRASKEQPGKQATSSLLAFLFDVFVSFQTPVKTCQEEITALQSLGFWTETDVPHNEDWTPSSTEGRTNNDTAAEQRSFEQHGTREVYARKLLGYLALGSSAGDGLKRLLATSVEKCPFDTSPTLKQEDSLSVYDLYMTCMGVGVRPPFQAIPPTVKVPLSSFYKILRTDGKGPENSVSAEGNVITNHRVNLLEFLNSTSSTHVLMYSGPYFIRRTITNFL